MDRWKSYPIVCKGGIDLYTDAITKGTSNPGLAVQLQNYEPALEGGYERILGYAKYDSQDVPGTGTNPITGVIPALGGVFAVRKLVLDNAIYYSTGAGWSAKLNAGARAGAVVKSRFIQYSISDQVIVLTDSVNPAWKYDGATETILNGTGAPTDPTYAAEHLKRLVLAGYSSNPQAITLSAPNDDTIYTAADGAIEINVGDTIVGLKSFRDTLYIFCENSIWKLVGSTSDDFAIQPVTKSIGCVAGDTVQEVGGDLVFLAPDGLRSVAATERIGDVELGLLSKSIQPLIREQLASFDPDFFDSCVVRGKSQYRLFYYKSTFSDSEQKGFLGRLESRGQEGISYSWATLKGIPVYCSDSFYVNNVELVVFGHPTDGSVYKMESGSDFAGSNIEFIYETPQLFFDDVELRKVLFKIKIFLQIAGDSTLNFDTVLDFGDVDTSQPETIILDVASSGGAYGSAIYGTAVYGGIEEVVFKSNLVGSGFSASFKFSGTNASDPHRIDSFVISYSIKGRR